MEKKDLIKIAKPILFNTEMVKAILDGRKTQTRRAIKLQHNNFRFDCFNDEFDDFSEAIFYDKDIDDYTTIKNKIDIGDVLYVKETFCLDYVFCICFHYCNCQPTIIYKADYKEINYKWKPSIHMPKEYARIFLKVANVRVERLQDMDLKQETGSNNIIEHKKYHDLWNSTAKDGYRWEDNPYVFVYEFERIDCESIT